MINLIDFLQKPDTEKLPIIVNQYVGFSYARGLMRIHSV